MRALKLQFVRALVSMGIVCLTSRIAVYGPVCTVVWEGGVVRLLPIPIGHYLRYDLKFLLLRAIPDIVSGICVLKYLIP